jgi:hypothetical protein
MFDGEQFQRECEEQARAIESGAKPSDPANVARLRGWARLGAALVDHSDDESAVR